MASNPILPFVNPQQATTSGRLSYPALLAVLGAMQGAQNTGSDWVDLGSGFRAYDSSPKRAIMGAVSGMSQGYGQGILQERQAEALAQNDALKRKMDADTFKAELGLKTEAEKELIAKREDAKVLAQTDPRILEKIALGKGYPSLKAMLDDEKVARDLARKIKENADTRATYAMQDKQDAQTFNQNMQKDRLGLDRDRLALAISEQQGKIPLIDAQTKLALANADKAGRPPSPNVSKIKMLALADTQRKFPNIPSAMLLFNAESSMYYNSRVSQLASAAGIPEQDLREESRQTPPTAPVSSLFK